MTLTFYDVARIDDYYVRQASVTKDLAKVENRLTVNSVSATPQKAEVTVAYSYKEGEKVTEQKRGDIAARNKPYSSSHRDTAASFMDA
mgnify:CR=1 FL=1